MEAARKLSSTKAIKKCHQNLINTHSLHLIKMKVLPAPERWKWRGGGEGSECLKEVD